jgi:hypothetical protein
VEVLKNRRNLDGSRFGVDEGLSIDVRKIRKELIPYLKEAKRRGHNAFLRKGTLIVNGKMDLSYLKEKIQLGDVKRQLDNPASTQKRLSTEQEIQPHENWKPYGGERTFRA